MAEDPFVSAITRAFLSLDEDDRRLVLGELVRRGVSRSTVAATEAGVESTPHWTPAPGAPPIERLERLLAVGWTPAQGAAPAAADQSTLLVRLDREQHEQLRLWCAQHHFSLATVVRGLVGRFLEQQGAQPAA